MQMNCRKEEIINWRSRIDLAKAIPPWIRWSISAYGIEPSMFEQSSQTQELLLLCRQQEMQTSKLSNFILHSNIFSCLAKSILHLNYEHLVNYHLFLNPASNPTPIGPATESHSKIKNNKSQFHPHVTSSRLSQNDGPLPPVKQY